MKPKIIQESSQLHVIHGGFYSEKKPPSIYVMGDKRKTTNVLIKGDDLNHLFNTKRHIFGSTTSEHLGYVVLASSKIFSDFADGEKLLIKSPDGGESYVDIFAVDERFESNESSKLRCDELVFSTINELCSLLNCSQRALVRHSLRLCSFLVRCKECGFEFVRQDATGEFRSPYVLNFGDFGAYHSETS